MGHSSGPNFKVVVILLVIVGVAALALYRLSPRLGAKIRTMTLARRQAAEVHERFIAAFDSLRLARLYPMMYRTGVFTYSKFEGDFEKWTLTVSSTDWSRRDEASKKDVAASLWTAFRSIRAQAGGDPDDAELSIQDEAGKIVARCTPATGVLIHP